MASSITSPRAIGLRSPFARVSGPSPKNTASPVPPKTMVPSVSRVQVMAPSIDTGPKSRLPLSATENTSPSSSPKTTCRAVPSPSTVTSMPAPVVLRRTVPVAVALLTVTDPLR